MSKYRVIYTDEVYNDIDMAIEYIAVFLHAPKAAFNLQAKIEEKKKFLEINPYMYSEIPNKNGLRFIPIGNYLMFFRINRQKKTVIVLKFIYGRRDWQNMPL